MTSQHPAPLAPWYETFHELMAYRVREVLLVSSPYDAFTLEEDGRLTERLFLEYAELNLSSAPRITHASTGARALEIMRERRFDLIITMVRLEDVDVNAFGRLVKQAHPEVPVVLLSFSEADLKRFPGGVDRTLLDGVFVWTGDARILLAIIKLVEDARNVEHDTKLAGVRVIIIVEDRERRYSSFLTLLYRELMLQSASLIAEGINEAHKMIRMRARPKLLLATTFEQAIEQYALYRDHAYAIISDVRFPRCGIEDPEAGYELVRMIRSEDPDLPILLQSAEPDSSERAEELGVHHVDKNSTNLLRRIRDFLKESLGFGDFIFRLPDRTEVARARNVFEMEEILNNVPLASVEFHGTRDHFSRWLMARGLFHLAAQLRPRTIADFGGAEGARQHILSILRQARLDEQEAVISDFPARRRGPQGVFVRLGRGSVGGKARGIAFMNSLLSRTGLSHRYPELEIRTPRTIAIGTDEFDRFLEDNVLVEQVHRIETDRDLLERFVAARLSSDLLRDLEIAIREMSGPLAVRSSSLLEDAQFMPFAGIYATYMLPNSHPNPNVRFDELRRAVKAVYASTFSKNARSYIEGTPYSVEEEKMGVIIQKMVGRRRGPRFYPHVSGVALSYNYYPFGEQRAEDGLALVALGLGHIVVGGGGVLQFSPGTPALLPQFPSPSDFLRDSQSYFCALDMSRHTVDFSLGYESSLVRAELSDAEVDGTLQRVASVYSFEDDLIRDNLSLPGPRVVTFNNILRWGSIPLAPALLDLLQASRHGLGCPVEIEFAIDLGDGDTPARLYILQIRPQATLIMGPVPNLDAAGGEDTLCFSSKALGHGLIKDVRDVVYVRQGTIESLSTPLIANAVGEINGELSAARRPYLLIGPGRWGSSDVRLGIPVEWSQISGARVIVETSFSDRAVEPSQGSHFFHNLTAHQIGYLTISRSGRDSLEGFVDWEWLDRQPAERERQEVRHVAFEEPLSIYLDGRSGKATVLKPRSSGA
jgi:DNA-binding NarL/FixJ family response regulator